MLAAMRAVIAVSWGLRVPELELDAVSAAVRVRTGELCRAEAHPWHLQPCSLFINGAASFWAGAQPCCGRCQCRTWS